LKNFILEIIKMTRMTRIGIFALAVCFVFAANCGANTVKVKPLKQLQDEFLQLKFGMFLHFNIATFNSAEWAGGKESPSIFNPVGLDCGQWADAALLAGMKYGILTTKHVDGFSLWDSAVTKHDVASSPYKKDVVKQFADAFRKKGLKVGLYYSVWDRHHNRQRRSDTVIVNPYRPERWQPRVVKRRPKSYPLMTKPRS
jgi:alpha-L-fucosidase